MVEEQLREIMNKIKTVYEKPSQTNQANLDTPHILMYVNKIDKKVKTLKAKLIEKILIERIQKKKAYKR